MEYRLKAESLTAEQVAVRLSQGLNISLKGDSWADQGCMGLMLLVIGSNQMSGTWVITRDDVSSWRGRERAIDKGRNMGRICNASMVEDVLAFADD